MRRSLLAALLAFAGTAHAALPRVEVDAPLTTPSYTSAPSASITAGLSAFGLNSPAPFAAPLAAAPAVTFSAAPLASPVASPVAAPLALHAAPALRELPIPADAAAPVSAAAAAPARQPRAIDSLRTHGADAAAVTSRLGSMSVEDAAPALSRDFDAAATFDPGTGGQGGLNAPLPPGGHPQKLLPAPHHELLSRLLERVTLDDGGDSAKRAELTAALTRMLQSATSRGLVEDFIASGAKAVIRFEEFPGSRIVETDGRKLFHAPRAFTEWRKEDGTVIVRLNQDYLGTDHKFLTQDLPPTIAHELLGHGLWYHRAVAQDAYQAFHHHELNETNARLVGWLTDYELDGRFEENGAWSYLQDPAGFLSYLKLRLPYYALTFSNAELKDPVGTLEDRLFNAKSKRTQLQQERENNASWIPVADHFVKDHGVPGSKMRALRAHLKSADQGYADDLAVNESLITEVEATLGRMRAEPDQASERYLQWAATHPLFAELERETAERTRRLLDLVRRNPPPPDHASAKLAEDHWAGQITFDELSKMAQEDQRKHPEHWRR
jgi:hypothetical protein